MAVHVQVSIILTLVACANALPDIHPLEFNFSVCFDTSVSSSEEQYYRRLVDSAIQSRIAGEKIAGFLEEDGDVVSVFNDEQRDYMERFVSLVDNPFFHDSQMQQLLMSGVIPSPKFEQFGMDWILEQRLLNMLYRIKGPVQQIFNLLQENPELKYQPERLDELLGQDWNEDEDNMATETDTNTASKCQSDQDYLYGFLSQTLHCVLAEGINSFIRVFFPTCATEGFIKIPLCRPVIAPSTPRIKETKRCKYTSIL